MNSQWLDYYEKSMQFEPNSTVLEIAPGTGHFTEIYNRSNLKKYIAVEPSQLWFEILSSQHYNCKTEFHKCGYENYTPIDKIDYVVCTGLLYHLSSPVHFIETIANKYNPNIIYLETTGHMNSDLNNRDNFLGKFYKEEVDKLGNRHTDDITKKIVPYNLTITLPTIVKFFEHVGYSLESYSDMSIANTSKHAVCSMILKKN